MRYHNNHSLSLSKTLALLLVTIFLFTGKSYAKSDLYQEIATIYPSLEQTKFTEQDVPEVFRLILFEMELAYKHQDSLIEFYAEHEYQTVWVKNGQPTAKAKKLLQELDNSWTHGLNPEKYKANELYNMMEYSGWQESLITQVLFDLGVSHAAALYAEDLSGVRSDLDNIHIDKSHWRKPVDPVTVLIDLHKHEDVTKVFRSLYPNNVLYEELRYALIKNVRQLTPYDSNPYYKKASTEQVELTIHPSTNHSLIPSIRNDLIEMSGYNDAVSSSTYYDSHLYHLVKDFQRRHNIVEDGIIGPQTLELMQKNRRSKIDQIIANMERLRWIDFERPDKYIVVNVPSSRLWAIQAGETKLQMPVVVGRKERPTPSFVAHIEGVRFNPSWTIPQSIKTQDFYPKISENPDILHEKEIEVFDGYGVDAPLLDPDTVDWTSIGPEDLRRFNMVQKPGDHNALGRFRFLMHNKDNIYLHDTNQPEMFKKSYRAESSGCVRVAEPAKLVSFVLNQNTDKSEQDLDKISQSLAETDIRAKNSVPVYILYLTIWFQNDGTLVFGPDIYDYDSQLIRTLRHKDAIFEPQNKSNRISALTNSEKNG